MSRELGENKCPVCGQEPIVDELSRKLTCACPGSPWEYRRGVVGSPEDRALLESHGWHAIETPHTLGVEWHGPLGSIVYLYDDGTWGSVPKKRAYPKLEDYLAWFVSGRP
jgi:hypothetical protein